MTLRVHSRLPDGLLECDATALHRLLGGPTLIRLAGGRTPALFVSVLLHGNETSGWDGVRTYLRANPEPERDLTLFVGNTRAAEAGVRALPDQPDFNRIWRNTGGAGGAVAAAVRAAIAHEVYFASVDLHNNTGHNPYYSVLTELAPLNLGLAQLFSDKAVYVEEPDTVLTRLFTGRCPAVTLEAGPVGDPRCAQRVTDFLSRLMALDAVPVARADSLSLFRTRVRVHVREGVTFGFEGDEARAEDIALVLTGGVEAVNFHELSSGTVFGASGLPAARVLRVLDVSHRDVTGEYFQQDGREILLKQAVVPAMYTTDPYVVRQDCLCYFMERMEF